MLQVPEEQVLQVLAPSEAGDPSELLENNESTRLAQAPQPKHWASSSARFIGLNNSNLSLQSEQRYSYIGIFPPSNRGH